MANTGKRGKGQADIDRDLVRELAELLDETNLTEIEYGKDGWHIRVAKHGTPVAAPAAFAAAPSGSTSARGASPDAADGSGGDDFSDATGPGVVRSPMVGVVYTAPEPEQPPFVRVGDKVERGQTLLLIEAMKVFNPIEAPVTGTISHVIVNNGAPVEFDEPLLIIEE